MIKRIKQLISKVRTNCYIWRFNIQLKAIIQRTYIFLDTIILYPIFVNLVRKLKIFSKEITAGKSLHLQIQKYRVQLKINNYKLQSNNWQEARKYHHCHNLKLIIELQFSSKNSLFCYTYSSNAIVVVLYCCQEVICISYNTSVAS